MGKELLARQWARSERESMYTGLEASVGGEGAKGKDWLAGGFDACY